ncbi:MAG: sterol desaturase family protein [Planctomycetes bacterium]|nr:sterol desaturase family protein [Planctomycetota bacterium]
MSYLAWLAVLSLAAVIAERLRPARRGQRVLRPELHTDLVYVLFNGHVWAVLTGGITGACALWTRSALDAVGLLPARGILDGVPFAAQLVAFLVASDFLQWCVHRLLHRVPFLWAFHKVHHSARAMDWAVNFRFHWMELVVYRSLLYVPLLWLGGDGAPLFAVAVFATAWGHLNHANVALDLGPLAYVFNSPRMHLWHHDASSEGGVAKNFGIVLSAWDWIFRTAYWPRERAPERIGYPDDQEMPSGALRQELFPLTRVPRAEHHSP